MEKSKLYSSLQLNEVQNNLLLLLWYGEQRGLGGLPHERLRGILARANVPHQDEICCICII